MTLVGNYGPQPILEQWARTRRWLHRLRQLPPLPHFTGAQVDLARAWELTDHAGAVLASCDAFRDSLINREESVASAAKRFIARPPTCVHAETS